MKKKLFSAILIGFWVLLFMGGPESAKAISFDEPGIFVWDTDPLIDNVQFFAGDPWASPPNDTMVDDWWTPGNQYLISGYDDGTGGTGDQYDTFIGAYVFDLSLFSFGSVSLDIALEDTLPGGTTLTLAAVNSDTIVGQASTIVSDFVYQPLAIDPGVSFDTVYIWDDLDAGGLGTAFHIDDFEFTEYSGGPGQPVPEPATLFLLGAGIAGLAIARKCKKA